MEITILLLLSDCATFQFSSRGVFFRTLFICNVTQRPLTPPHRFNLSTENVMTALLSKRIKKNATQGSHGPKLMQTVLFF